MRGFHRRAHAVVQHQTKESLVMTSRIERLLIALMIALLAAGLTLIVTSAPGACASSRTNFI